MRLEETSKDVFARVHAPCTCHVSTGLYESKAPAAMISTAGPASFGDCLVGLKVKRGKESARASERDSKIEPRSGNSNGKGATWMKVDSGRALERVDVVTRENRNGETREREGGGSRAKAAAVRNLRSDRSRRMGLSGTEISRPSVSILEADPSRVVEFPTKIGQRARR